ncbi:MAG: HDOD domain-containing protein, partial [Phycisphaerales bacterium]
AGAPGRAGAAAASPAQAAALAALSMAGPATPPVDLAGGLKGLRPMLTRSDLLAKVDASAQLKALTPTVAQVLKLTASDRTSIETVSRAIAQDQAIALKILKLSNSAAYTRGEPVDSVQKAVVRIGLDRIRQAVLNLAVIDQFTSAAFQGPLNTLQFWEHAIATGLIAAELAHAQGEKEADAAFTMGLLHDVGRIIYAEQLGPAYVEVIHAAQALGAPLEQVESRLLLMSHADVMDRILHAWGFANHLVNPIVHHHLSPANARNVAPKQLTEILRLGLADRLAHALLLGASGNDTIYPIDEHCQALRLDGAAIQRVEETARTETDNMKFTMLSNTSGAPWPKRRDELRSMLNAPFRPLFVSAEPRVDSYRMFCDALADPGGEEPPNVAIVHLAAGRDRAGVSQALLAAERERGVQELPAVVLSPGAKLTLEGPAATRRSELLATPVQAQRLLDAVGMLLEGRAAWAA